MTTTASPGRRVLACDDEPQILRALTVILRDDGYAVVTAASAEEALDRIAGSPVDAAIVDPVLPGEDGLVLCRRLRAWSEMPIIVLSAIGEEEQKVAALNAGADDYVTKPFGPRELLARLAAVLRRVSAASEPPTLVAGGLRVDLAGHTVRRDGEELHLTPKEFDLLALLIRNPGRLLTHRVLLSQLWGQGCSDDTTVLRSHIARLRRKIEPPDRPGPVYIRTEPGIGFRFQPTGPAFTEATRRP